MTKTQENALRLLGLCASEANQEAIKKAYRKACSKFHPDRGGSKEMMQAVNEAYEVLKNFNAGDYAHNAGGNESDTYPDDLNNAINAIAECDGLIVEVCGLWVWVTGDTKPHKETLKAAGYKWAKVKKAWFFKPDDHKSRGRGSMDLEEIRARHGSSEIKVKGRQKLKAA